MPESQLIEWKRTWNDKYLQWICGFANAGGGTLIIGKDDDGNPVGVADAKKLLEGLPSKIQNKLGLVCSVNLQNEKGLDLIEIITPPSSMAVSLRGHYYYRTGSTTRKLTGQSLTDFLLAKSGTTWDAITEPTASLKDIDTRAINAFLHDANKAGRLPDVSDTSLEHVLEKLQLLRDGQLTRAAIVLFGKEPGRFYSNLFVRIGRFGTSKTDLRFQEESKGNLIHMIADVQELLERKFLIKLVRFEGINRIETLEYPVDALRELVLNALIHRNYGGSMVQIAVYDDRLSIWNEGKLPDSLPLNKLLSTHHSLPRNPLIARTCYQAGYIENWGLGIEKVFNACEDAGLGKPLFEENSGGLRVTLPRNVDVIAAQLGGLTEAKNDKPARKPAGKSSDKPITWKREPAIRLEHIPKTAGKSPTQSGDPITNLISLLETGPMSSGELRKLLGLSHRASFRENYLRPCMKQGLIEMTIPETPGSRLQKYRLTPLGKKKVKQLGNKK